MAYGSHHAAAPASVGIAILTVSDTKGPRTDASGAAILDAILAYGHRPAGRAWSPDEGTEIRDRALELLAEPDADALIVTGGTGAALRDVTVETLRPLFSKELPGFGELFRRVSQDEIKSGAMLSRATAGIILSRGRAKPVFLLPGAPEACLLAVDKVIAPEVGHLVELAGGHRHA
jgi:molybdopterin adenylyltransferase